MMTYSLPLAIAVSGIAIAAQAIIIIPSLGRIGYGNGWFAGYQHGQNEGFLECHE